MCLLTTCVLNMCSYIYILYRNATSWKNYSYVKYKSHIFRKMRVSFIIIHVTQRNISTPLYQVCFTMECHNHNHRHMRPRLHPHRHFKTWGFPQQISNALPATKTMFMQSTTVWHSSNRIFKIFSSQLFIHLKRIQRTYVLCNSIHSSAIYLRLQQCCPKPNAQRNNNEICVILVVCMLCAKNGEIFWV